MSSSRQLFGGAITITLPTTLIDASTLRQIPDTQEVFVDKDSDVSFVVEILEKVKPDDLADAARFHFDSLAHDNDAVSSTVNNVEKSLTTIQSVPDNTTPPPVLLYGTQQVPKFNRTIPDDVDILLAVYRITNKDTDVVLSVNLPKRTESNTGLNPDQLQEGRDAFITAARSLKIIDFGLFA